MNICLKNITTDKCYPVISFKLQIIISEKREHLCCLYSSIALQGQDFFELMVRGCINCMNYHLMGILSLHSNTVKPVLRHYDTLISFPLKDGAY